MNSIGRYLDFFHLPSRGSPLFRILFYLSRAFRKIPVLVTLPDACLSQLFLGKVFIIRFKAAKNLFLCFLAASLLSKKGAFQSNFVRNLNIERKDSPLPEFRFQLQVAFECPDRQVALPCGSFRLIGLFGSCRSFSLISLYCGFRRLG